MALSYASDSSTTDNVVSGGQGGSSAQSNQHERRRGVTPIPLNLREFINDDQRRTLKQIEGFGWSLAFVRRPLFQDPIVIIRNSDASAYSVLEEDGTINSNPDITIRH